MSSINQTPVTENKPLMKSMQFNTPKLNNKLLGKRPSFFKNVPTSDSLTLKIEQNDRISLKKQIRKNYSKTFLPCPKISAKSYIVYEKTSSSNDAFKIHLALNSKIRVQVASLTKIMTCILAIQICQNLALSPTEQFVRIGKFQSSIGGTSAKIEAGDQYNLEDLLYGLMLPSGNDASLAIAVWGGKQLVRQSVGHSQEKKLKKEYVERFIHQMNKKARSLDMSKTVYANSHGLVNNMNKSCAHDVAHLSQYAMANATFRKVVSTKFYSTIAKVYEKRTISKDIQNQDEGESGSDETDNQNGEKKNKLSNINLTEEVLVGEREITWENTHKLLHSNSHQYVGIKTGVTTAAGPCLSSCISTQCGRTFYVVVLNCKKLSSRFKETDQLKKWIFKQEGIKKIGHKNHPRSEVTSFVSQDNDLSDLEKYGPEDD